MKLLPMKVTALLPGFLKGGKVTTPRGVSDTEVLGVQTKWAAAIAHISDVHAKGGDFVGAAADAAGELYAYGHGDVEYTFGYKRCEDDEVRIFLHHSSVPYAA
ncbi:hypothetical protein JL720_16561 [Aureococcus anophagefferens]|nr:hypothetical protein JL720_16561 [Aureococcus anophagefferens]